MGNAGFDVKNIRKLAELVEKHGLAELTVEADGLCITIKGPSPSDAAIVEESVVCTAPSTAPVAVSPSTAPSAPAQYDQHLHKIQSPMVGVFYRSVSPDAPPS